jgi:1-acyl-sn-glycerol-3-phosphate acyltransferase
MSVTRNIRTPPGLGLRQCSGALEDVGSSGALESGAAVPHSKTLSRPPRAKGQPHSSRLIHQPLPRISPLLLRWFTWYCRGYIRRHFHSLRISINGLPPDVTGYPVMLFTNHASWWDPLVGLVLKEACFPQRNLYAPIDAAMLQRYRMFAKLGFFGVEQGTRRGAVQFLRTSEAVLGHANSLLAITPQSRFADVRERPLRFQSGLGRVAAQVENVVFLPMATEFVFWEERLPEILVRFGEPVLINSGTRRSRTYEELSAHLEEQLTIALDALAVEAQRRDASDFRTILHGGAGQGGVYDLWRKLKAKLRGETFVKEHGRK